MITADYCSEKYSSNNMQELTIVSFLAALAITRIKCCVPGQDENCNQATFDPLRWCNHCLTVRQGRMYYEDPFDVSYFYQCAAGNAYRQRCSPCTYWLQEQQTCGSLHDAKLAYGTSAKYRIREQYGNTCNKYIECGDYGGYTVECCERSANYFDKENAQFGTSVTCITNSACTEVCYATEHPHTTVPTTPGQVYDVTCTPSTWPSGYHVLPNEPNCYIILRGDGTAAERKRCCEGGQYFNVSECACITNQVAEKCIKVEITFTDDIVDIAQNNYIDRGTVEVNAEDRGVFTGLPGSSLEIPFFKNKFPYVNEMSISVWFYKTGSGDLMGIITNGDCNETGSVNIWIQGDNVFGGVLTGTATSVKETMIKSSVVDVLNKWHHAVLTFRKLSSSSSEYHLYINGALQGRRTGDGNILQSFSPLIMARQFCYGGVTTGRFVGQMDNFRYYECYLTGDEVMDLYQYQLPDVSR